MPLNNPAKAAEINTGSYTGDASANKAIPHGLTKVPKFVLIFDNTAAANDGYNWALHQSRDRIHFLIGGANSSLVVTAMDSTNFYVGNATNYTNSANANTIAYLFVAMA